MNLIRNKREKGDCNVRVLKCNKVEDRIIVTHREVIILDEIRNTIRAIY